MENTETPAKLNPRPLGEKILVRQDPAEKMVGKSKLIWAPDGSENWPTYGTVIAIGSRCPLKDDIKIGDRVVFKRQAHGSGGGAMNPDWREGDAENWKDLLVLKAENLLGVVDP